MPKRKVKEQPPPTPLSATLYSHGFAKVDHSSPLFKSVLLSSTSKQRQTASTGSEGSKQLGNPRPANGSAKLSTSKQHTKADSVSIEIIDLSTDSDSHENDSYRQFNIHNQLSVSQCSMMEATNPKAAIRYIYNFKYTMNILH
jgi:hypothetical protein